MNNKQENKRSPIGHAGIALFGNIRVMAVAALLTALSIVLGKYLAVNVTDSLRISFENLPILMAGLFFGPLIGGVVGAAADMIGCFLVGYSINPIITLGAFLIGVISGIIGMYAFPGKENWRATPRVFLPVALSHIICSIPRHDSLFRHPLGNPYYARADIYLHGGGGGLPYNAPFPQQEFFRAAFKNNKQKLKQIAKRRCKYDIYRSS